LPGSVGGGISSTLLLKKQRQLTIATVIIDNDGQQKSMVVSVEEDGAMFGGSVMEVRVTESMLSGALQWGWHTVSGGGNFASKADYAVKYQMAIRNLFASCL
jgi:hypothetical protein